MIRYADWQLANPSGTKIRDWIIAPLYDGLLRTALATGDAKYLAAVLRMGTQAGWMPSNRVYHADDHAVGHAWLDIHLMDPTRVERLAPMRDRLSYVIDKPVNFHSLLRQHGGNRRAGTEESGRGFTHLFVC